MGQPTKLLPLVAVALASLLLLTAAYFGAYYAMLSDEVAFEMDGDDSYFLAGETWPVYRVDGVDGFFWPAHQIDRRIRPSRWHVLTFPPIDVSAR